MKNTLPLAFLLSSVAFANASVTIDHLWSFNGTTGTVSSISASTLPDTGVNPVTVCNGGTNTKIANTTPSPTGGSTYWVTDGSNYSGVWGASRSGYSMATDNFGIQMWLRLDPSIAASNSTQNAALFTSATGNGGLVGNIMLNYTSSGFQVAKYVNNIWNSQNVLISGSQTLNDNNWHNVAVVSVNGTTSLYVDGIIQGTASATYAGGNEDLHLALKPNGGNNFAGNLDEVSYFTFNNTTTVFNPLTDLYINQIPEPSVYAAGILAMGVSALLLRRRKTAR